VIGVNCVGDPSQFHQVLARWRTPNVGGVGQYTVYRVNGGSLVPGQPWTLVGQVPAVSGQTDYSLLDSTPLVNGAQYTYFAVAVYADGIASDPSNLVTITVPLANFTFVGLQNVPPPPGARFNGGSAIPMKWQFTNGTTVVDSSHVAHVVTVRGPLPNGPIRTITNTDPGSSSFRYSSGRWAFNLQTREPNGQKFAAGVYDVTITPTTPGYGPSPTFQITVR
jgi:hypothetical protein